MTRSILLSLLAIGVAVTVIAVAGTQAVFTDSQTASGDVNAGTVDLYLLEGDLSDDNGANEFIFDIPAAENLLPGQSSVEIVRLRNDGTATLTVATLDTTGSTGAECDASNAGDEFSVAVTGVTAGVTTIAPGAFVDATVTVSLALAADNDCQGDVYSVSLAIGVTS
jgi:predicted ribosomally synthesized peptide with SipW-like signal peptide